MFLTLNPYRLFFFVGSLTFVATAVACAPFSSSPAAVVAEALPTPTVGAIRQPQAVAQAGSAGQAPLVPPGGGGGLLAQEVATPTRTPAVASSCPDTPADWTPYHVQRGDTVYRIGVVYGAAVAALARANCLADPRLIHVGQTIFVPPERYAPGDLPPEGGSASLPDGGPIGGSEAVAPLPGADSMPIAITHFAADRLASNPGQPVCLTWATQGAVAAVELGWLHQGTVIPELTGLPPSGMAEITIPADGRRTMPFVLQISDGETVASAFATVEVNCAAGWFFQPAPVDVCPYDPVRVRVTARQFERGLILYLPVLDRLYALFSDGEWLVFLDAYRPGMPFHDPTVAPPEGLQQPEGAIGYLWRTEPGVAERLGWASQGPVGYDGAMQRAVYPDHDLIYLTAPGDQILVLAEGAPWQVMTTVEEE